MHKHMPEVSLCVDLAFIQMQFSHISLENPVLDHRREKLSLDFYLLWWKSCQCDKCIELEQPEQVAEV